MKRLAVGSAFLVACAHATTVANKDTTAKVAPSSQQAASTPANGERSGSTQSRLERQPKHPGEALVTSSPSGLLKKGSASLIQEALLKHGETVKETGVLDEQTSEALRHFQKAQNIAEHGQPDELTLTRLGLDPLKLYRSNVK